MLFSICIPAYNAEKTIRRAIESIQSQNFNDYEIIVVDDGSIDSTANILKELSLHNNRIHVLSGRRGLFRARIDAIKNSHGDYILFLDADDEFTNSALSVIDAAISCSYADMVQFGALKLYSDGQVKPILTMNHKIDSGDVPIGKYLFNSLMATDKYVTLWNKAIRRACFDVNGMLKCDNITVGEDGIMMLYTALNIKSYVYVPDLLYMYSVSTGLTKRFRNDCFKDYLTRVKIKEDLLRGGNIYDDDYKRCIGLYSIKTVAKLIVYGPTCVSRNNDSESGYYKVLEEIRSNDNIWELLARYGREVSVIYRFPFWLMRYRLDNLLLTFKRICAVIRNVRR